jgi:hypothetical protein
MTGPKLDVPTGAIMLAPAVRAIEQPKKIQSACPMPRMYLSLNEDFWGRIWSLNSDLVHDQHCSGLVNAFIQEQIMLNRT